MITLEIMSAEAKKIENFFYEKEQERLKEERKEKEEQNKEKAIEKLFNMCKTAINDSHYGYCSCTITLTKVITLYPYADNLIPNYEDKLKESFNVVQLLLAQAGYSATLHCYSKSWVTRSGRFAEINIRY